MDFAILAEMSQRQVACATNIITFFEKNFNIFISPGTIYPVFKKLEKKKYIKKVPHKTKTLYMLTNSGRNALLEIQQNMNEFQSLISDLLLREKIDATE
ncbi:MAG: helix-turn-helix transcriptional regulator [Candidatus Bathyarchaeota archaeon]|nr:helix-turn-helix transcriptional regulator [Candidatus Bathyarchaeum tardum]